ncbi:MAG TPA: PQQ-binding-like beta-propeller repeat protein [Planctomycetota bacterium]|nr:PQQ-binding-like beta-propeller repeat protein [Planctomycetota bacterium]
MRSLALAVFLLGQSDEFDPSKVNKLIVSLAEDPSQEAKVAELHEYLKAHGKLSLIYSKFEESFERRPKDAKLRYLLGRLHLRDGNRPAALKCFQAAALADPEYPYTYLAQSELCQEQGDETGLVAALEGVMQSSREKAAVAGAVRKLTAYYGKKQDLDRVASLWAGLGERFPDDADILGEALRGMVSAGRLPRARDCLRSVLSQKALPPAERARFFLELSGLERRSGSASEAAKALAAASEAAGDDSALTRQIDESILTFHREENRLGELAAQRAQELQQKLSDPLRRWRLARVYLAQGTPSRARELLVEGLQIIPGNLMLLSGLAEVAAQQKKFAEVRDLCREIAKREPLQREHRKREGLACLELSEFDEAAQAFKLYAVTGIEFAEVGQIYEKRNRLAEAVPYYSRSIELRPDPALSRTLVGVYIRLDRVADAEREALRCTAGERERWALLRELLLVRGEPRQASAYARKDAEANPKDFGAQVTLGRLLVELRHSDAEPTLRKALTLAKKGERGEVFEELAALAATQGPSAILILRAELRVRINEEPDDGGYYYALYRLPSGPDGRGGNPVKVLEEGRKNDPRHVRLRQELAPYYVQQKQYDVAIDVYRELLEIDPRHRDVYSHFIGEIYWSLGHKEEAFSWWAKVSGPSKDRAGLSFQLAKKYEAEKRYPQAIELLEQILKEEPEGVLYHWTLAHLYRQVNNYDGIEAEYKWILANAKDEGYRRTARQVLAEKMTERGRALALEGKLREAREAFVDGLRFSPDEPATGTLLTQIARLCEQLREFPKAAEYYHQLLFKYPTLVVTVSPGRTMNAGLFATVQLRGNPECLRAYEELVGAQARTLLQDALQKADRVALERILAAYPLTEAAGLAAYSIAESYRKEGEKARAAGYYERLLAEFPLGGIDEALIRVRLVDLASQLKDWGVLSTHLGELVARFKDKVLTVDGRSVVIRDFVKNWQKELLTHGVGLGATWGLLGKDSKNSCSAGQELVPPLQPRWKFQACTQGSGDVIQSLPPVYVSGGLVMLVKASALVALDSTTGNLRWSVPLRALRGRPKQANFWTSGAPMIEGRLAVSQGVVLGSDNDAEFRAFDAASGATLWNHVSDVARLEEKGVNKMRVAMYPMDHLEIVSATRQCFIVREGDKLRAYALRTGRLEWQTDVLGPALPVALDPGPGASGREVPDRLERIVVESDGVLVHAYGDSIRALDTITGRDLWEVTIPAQKNASTSPWAGSLTMVTEGVARAAVAGEFLIVLTAAQGKTMALELRTGRLRWDIQGEGPGTEGQLAADDQYVYIVTPKLLAVHSSRNGERVWRRELRPPAPVARQGLPPAAAIQGRLAVSGSRLFFTTGEDQGAESAKVEAIDRKTGTTGWEYTWEPIGRLINGLRALGTDPWGRPIPSQLSAPVVCDGWLYVVRSDGMLTAFHGKSQEIASLRDAIRLDPESPMAHFRLGDLLGSEGSTSLEIEEYRTALKLALKKADTPALKEMVTEVRARLFVRFMKQGEGTADLEASLKAFAEARIYADGESSLARVLVRTASVLLALKRELEAIDVLSSIGTLCSAAPSPLDGIPESAGAYAARQLGRLGPQVRAQWEKAHAEEMEKAFGAGKSVEELEKAIDRYSFSTKADEARIRTARVYLGEKRYKEVVQTLDKLRPEFLAQAEAELFFDAYDLLGRALVALGEDRRALGITQKLLTEIAKDEARLGGLKARAEARHNELKESWERNGTFSTPLQTVWSSSSPASPEAAAAKPAPVKPPGPTMDAFRPAIDCGRIASLDVQGVLRVTDLGTSAPLWQANTEDFSSFLQAANNLTVLPLDPLLVARNNLVVVGGKTVRAFDGATGKALWAMTSVDGDVFAQQVVIEGNRVITCEARGRVTVREDRSGRLLWSTRPGASASGIVSDRSGTSGGGLVYSRVGVEGTRVVVQPAGDPGGLFAYDLLTGKQVWKVVDASYAGYLKGRVILEVGFGVACLADPSGLVVCHDLADGKVRWKLNLAAPIESVLSTPDRVVVATSEQIAAYASKNGKREWVAAADATNTAYSREKDMRIGATSMDAKGRWLVVGSATSVSIVELASGQQKDQIRPEGSAPSKPTGKAYPFGKSFVSVALSPEGILWGLPTEYGTQWSLLR